MASGDTVVSSKTVHEIRGGNLGNRIWTPSEIRVIDGMPFLMLGEKEYMLKVYLGLRNCHGFFKELIKKRNDAVDQLILAKLRETDDFVVAVTPKSRKETHLEQKIMTLAISSGNIEVIVDANEKKSVGLLLNAPNLNALLIWADHFKEAQPPPKRQRTRTVKVKANFVKSNVYRKKLSVLVVDSEGHRSYKTVKVTPWTQGLVDEAVEQLTEHLREHHHAEQDGEWVLASECGLDMFADVGSDAPDDVQSDAHTSSDASDASGGE